MKLLSMQKKNIRIGFIFLILCFTWLKACGCLEMITDPDPGLFESFSYHILQGKSLYVEIFDHKPPLIFELNQLFLKVFGHTENAIGYGSLLLCLLQSLFFYLLLIQWFKNDVLAFLGTLLFISIFYQYEYFGSGNYTEQYGVLCVTISTYFLFRYGERGKNISAFLSGLFLCLAVFFKEPFALAGIPIFLNLLYFRYKDLKKGKGIRWFIGAIAIVLALIIIRLLSMGIMEGFLEQLSLSFSYTVKSSKLGLLDRLIENVYYFLNPLQLKKFIGLLFLWLGYFVCLLGFLLNKKTRILGVFLILIQLTDFISTGLSGYYFAHYYIQSIPFMVIVIVGGLWNYLGFLKASDKLKYSLLSLLLLPLIYFSNPWSNSAANPEKKFNDPILAYLNEHEPTKPRNVSLAGKDVGFYLLRAEGISDSRFIVPYPYHWMLGIKVANEYAENFKKANPKYIIYSGTWSELVQDSNLDKFILAHYTEVIHTDLRLGFTAHLLKRNN